MVFLQAPRILEDAANVPPEITAQLGPQAKPVQLPAHQEATAHWGPPFPTRVPQERTAVQLMPRRDQFVNRVQSHTIALLAAVIRQ